jgi:glycerate kinase
MRILLAPNTFKESLSALEITRIFEEVFNQENPGVQIDSLPLADGGDGTLEVLVHFWDGSIQSVPSIDPLGRVISVPVGIHPDGKQAVVEMARVSGLMLLATHERNPLCTSSRGLGIVLRQLIDQGFRRIILGIGGSATVDGGCGMAIELGFTHYDHEGNPLPGNGESLLRLSHIEPSLFKELKQTEFMILCDVQNRLCGPTGAAAVYGPQKGATPLMVEQLDQGLAHLARHWETDLGQSVAHLPGTGAAGGLGGGVMVYLGAKLTPGAEGIASLFNLEDRVAQADLVITGEGRLDVSSLHGKLPAFVAHIAHQQQVPCLGLCGHSPVSDRPAILNAGFTEIVEIAPASLPLAERLQNARFHLHDTATRLARQLRRTSS